MNLTLLEQQQSHSLLHMMCFQLAAELAKQQKFEQKFDNRKPKAGEKAARFKKDNKDQVKGKQAGKLKGKPAADQTRNGKTPQDKHKKDTQGKKINNSANFEPVVYKRKVSITCRGFSCLLITHLPAV